MAHNSLTTGASLDDLTLYTTGQFQPTAGRLVLAFVLNVAGSFTAASTPTAAGNNLAWQQVRTIQVGGLEDHRLTCFRASGPGPVNGPLSFDFGGQTQTLCAWSVFEFADVDTSGPNGGVVQSQSATVLDATSLSAPLNPFADPAKNITVGGMILSLFAQTKQVTGAPGFTEVHQQALATGIGKGGTLQTQEKTGQAASVTWSWSGTEDAAAIVLELQAAAVPTPPPPTPQPESQELETLVRRFEPILYFHSLEQHFPSDAKRYVEHAALWATKAPFDAKAGWQRLVPRDGLAALPAEAGAQGDTPIDAAANIVNTTTDQRFLELTGWKDKAGAAVPDVTATSQHPYSNRTAIADLYNKDDSSGGKKALRESRYWYHAELFDTERLRRLLRSDGPDRGPDLIKLLDSFKEPHILCYYFFFPAHDESLAASCTNIEAQEIAAFGGEWACMALLLERDGPGQPFRASFVGHSGRRLTWVKLPNGTSVFPPHVMDPEDRFAMKANAFKPGNGPQASLPETQDDHPKLFVSLGTHSLYLAPGTHEVEPYVTFPQLCGEFDTPGDLPDDDDDPLYGPHGFLLKLWAGQAISPGIIGLGIGLALAALEDNLPPHGLNVTGTKAIQSPDEAPAPGTGRTVKPAGLSVADAGTDVEDWKAAQGVAIDGRMYDFLVERNRQPWWPNEDGRPSFQGRWGPRVENDKLPRRAGMTFPEYWRLFLLAIVDLQSKPPEAVGP